MPFFNYLEDLKNLNLKKWPKSLYNQTERNMTASKSKQRNMKRS